MRLMMLGLLAVSLASAAGAERFSFVAYGDTAYRLPRDAPRLARMVDTINSESPDFSIHVGDFKGYTSCSDSAFENHAATFARHAQPVILTLGDNDWFDCSVASAGSFDPLERLARLRSTLFAGDSSLGARPLPLVRQAGFPENGRWTRHGLIFATVHVIGPHNGFVRDARLAADAVARSKAGEAWVRAAFEAARAVRAPAVVLAFQADPWWQTAPLYENGPLDWLRNAIGEEAATFGGQVLVIHGDSHRLTIDTPYRRADIDAGTTRGLNVTRLQVPGWPDHRAVRIDVDTQQPGMFAFRVIMAADEAQGARP